MVGPGGMRRAAVAVIAVFLAAQCDAKEGKMGKMGKVGAKAVVAPAVPKPTPKKKEPRCEVTAWSGEYKAGGSKRGEQTFVDDGHDTIEITGAKCKFVGEAPSGPALVCFLYSALVIMPVLYYFSVHTNTGDYTWAFLDSFMGIFIAILWWSCFDEQFLDLDLPHRLGVFVFVRALLVPGVLFMMADHEYLFGIASILKHVVAFIGIAVGTQALKYGSGDGPPDVARLLGICVLVLAFNLAIWKFKNLFAEYFFKDDMRRVSCGSAEWVAGELENKKTNARVLDRWDEVCTELGMDVAGLTFAALLFLSVHMIYFRKTELLMEDANLGMTNTSLFDHRQEGVFAALYSLGMFVITIIMEHFGGGEHSHPPDAHEEVAVQPYKNGEEVEIAMCQRKGSVNRENVTLWERVLVLGNAPAGPSQIKVELVSKSVLEEGYNAGMKLVVDPGVEFVVSKSDLRPAKEEEWHDYLWHLMQLAMLFSASWSGLLALCFLIRQHWFPFLLEKHLEGSLFVSVVLMFLSGIVIAALSAHAAQDNKIMSNKIMKYFRVYFLRAVSLIAALSWDMTFDAAVEELPVESIPIFNNHKFAGKLFVCSLMTFFIAPIYVLGMRSKIHAATALLEHKEMLELEHEKEE